MKMTAFVDILQSVILIMKCDMQSLPVAVARLYSNFS